MRTKRTKQQSSQPHHVWRIALLWALLLAAYSNAFHIYRAILARDPEAARAMMRMHLTRSRERLRLWHEATKERDAG